MVPQNESLTRPHHPASLEKMRAQGGWRKVLTTMLSLMGCVVVVVLGAALGMKDIW